MPPSLPEAGDRDRGAGELFARRLVVARGFGDAADLGGEIVQRARLDVAHHRHFQALRRLRGDAHVHGLVLHEHAARRIVQRIALREFVQDTCQSGNDERQERERRSGRRAAIVEMFAQAFEAREIALFDIGVLRDAARRFGEAFGDDAPQADDLHFLGAVARRVRSIGARIDRRRRTARRARGQRGVDVTRLDAARGPGARDGRQIEPGLGGAAAARPATP